ncbi:leukocyte elastase inhibitor-like [Pollicipes pollicipes]|uniref:leukocyte elastase inhibitor-like n=1 Tax=Pollicipes pollicipes TaxID=41117 RepID=UPI001884B239|nr:leukocyte elastase inhibitor-like [Pollicipes pollicipes]
MIPSLASSRRWGLALLLASYVAVWSCTASSDLLQLLSRAHFDFTLNMYGTLANVTDDRQQNLLISPYSVFSLLSMLFLGAGSESLSSAQLRAVLRFHNISYASVQRAFKEVTQVLDNPYYYRHFQEDADLLLTNGVTPADVYARALDEFYRRSVNYLNLGAPSAQEDLATWLMSAAGSGSGSDSGSGPDSPVGSGVRQLPDLEAALADNPVLLLVSRAHFHGSWMHPFDPARTFSKGLFFSKPSQRLTMIPSLASSRRWGLALLLASYVAVWSCTASSDLLQLLSRAHFDFTLNMYGTLANVTDDRQQNLLISPYSVFSLLSMLFLGAGSESLSSAQLRAVLRFHNISYASVQRAFKEVTQVLDNPYYYRHFQEDADLLLTNGVTPADVYARALDEFYRRSVNYLNLGAPSAQEDLATWLMSAAGSGSGSDSGSGPDSPVGSGVRQLPDLEAALADNPVLLLVSRAHFHGSWMHPFDPARTFSKGLFFSKPSQRMEVPMMTSRMLVPLGYNSDMEARVLELPLSTRRISVFLLLPDDMEHGLARLEANLTMDNLRTLLATLKEVIVNVKLPRFRMEGSGDLRRVLRTQGLTDVFDPVSSDLTGIDPQGRVHPGPLLYAASLVLDETGDSGDTSGSQQMAPSEDTRISDKYFEVDHPFLFLVWDYHSAMVLLMGRVVHPEPLF